MARILLLYFHKETEMTDDVLLQYIKDVKKYPLLSAEEEISLAEAAQRGNREAAEKLITSNLRLVIKIAKKYSTNYSQILELIQEGNIGLMKAVKKFSKSFNVRFSSYAALWIKQNFSRYLNSSCKMIKLPIRKEFLIRKLRHEEEKYMMAHGAKPSCSELAKILNETEKDIDLLKKLSEYDMRSLDAPMKDDNRFCMYDVIESNTYNPEETVIDAEFKSQLDKCLQVLNTKEQDIVKNRYGLDGIKKRTSLAALGKRYSISAESVRQTQLRALRKLQTQKNAIRSIAV